MSCSVGFLSYLVFDALDDWENDPSTSTIERVDLTELDFPAVTVCPDWATDQLAVQTIYNMVEFDKEVRGKLNETLDKLQKAFFEPKDGDPWMWIADFSLDNVANMQLRRSDTLNFALDNEGNLYNALFNLVDKALYDDCQVNGSYCQFNKRFLEILAEIEQEEWFLNSAYQNAPQIMEMVWNEDLQMHEPIFSAPEFFEINQDFMVNSILPEALIFALYGNGTGGYIENFWKALEIKFDEKKTDYDTYGNYYEEENLGPLPEQGGGGPPNENMPLGRKRRQTEESVEVDIEQILENAENLYSVMREILQKLKSASGEVDCPVKELYEEGVWGPMDDGHLSLAEMTEAVSYNYLSEFLTHILEIEDYETFEFEKCKTNEIDLEKFSVALAKLE